MSNSALSFPFGDDVRREERVPDRVETFLDGSGEDFPWHDRQDGVSRWGSLRRAQGDAFE